MSFWEIFSDSFVIICQLSFNFAPEAANDAILIHHDNDDDDDGDEDEDDNNTDFDVDVVSDAYDDDDCNCYDAHRKFNNFIN